MTDYPLRPEYRDLPEADILKRCRHGDNEAFNVLISRYEKRVFNLTLRYLRDYHRALEAAQEVFVKVFRKIRFFRGNSAFATWLHRITANHCLNVLKSLRVRGERKGLKISLDSARENEYHAYFRDPNAAAPDETVAEQRMFELLWGLMDALPPKQYQTIVLYHFEHLSYEDIARVMGLPLTTVRSCLFRARKRLQALYAEKGGAGL